MNDTYQFCRPASCTHSKFQRSFPGLNDQRQMIKCGTHQHHVQEQSIPGLNFSMPPPGRLNNIRQRSRRGFLDSAFNRRRCKDFGKRAGILWRTTFAFETCELSQGLAEGIAQHPACVVRKARRLGYQKLKSVTCQRESRYHIEEFLSEPLAQRSARRSKINRSGGAILPGWARHPSSWYPFNGVTIIRQPASCP